MSDSEDYPMFYAEGEDPEMLQAYESARATFRFFWREIACDRQRIVPALDSAAVKVPFTDANADRVEGIPDTEHMWISDVDFDGEVVSGVLINSPQWITTVKTGDRVSFPIAQISDWMYVISNRVYGAFTVNLLRARMNPQERREHDDLWGLEFGDPSRIELTNTQGHQKLDQHKAESFRQHFAQNPSIVASRGHNGWTFLHNAASAGSTETVAAILDAGADPNARTDNGMTALQIASVLGWDSVVAMLSNTR